LGLFEAATGNKLVTDSSQRPRSGHELTGSVDFRQGSHGPPAAQTPRRDPPQPRPALAFVPPRQWKARGIAMELGCAPPPCLGVPGLRAWLHSCRPDPVVAIGDRRAVRRCCAQWGPASGAPPAGCPRRRRAARHRFASQDSARFGAAGGLVAECRWPRRPTRSMAQVARPVPPSQRSETTGRAIRQPATLAGMCLLEYIRGGRRSTGHPEEFEPVRRFQARPAELG